MAEYTMEHEVGIAAPDFTLKDQDGKDIRLSDQKGKRVLLSFHPLAWTMVCTNQMQSIEDNYTVFESLKTLPLGMSVDPVPSKKPGQTIMAGKRYAFHQISGLTERWPPCLIFSARKTGSPKEPIS